MIASVIASRLLEDDFDPKEYVMSGPVSYHPVHLVDLREIRTWWLKHYGAPVKSIYRDKLGQIHGYVVDRENIIDMNRARPSPAESEYAIKLALLTWLHTTVKGGDRIDVFVHYYGEQKRIFFDLWRDDVLQARREGYEAEKAMRKRLLGRGK